MGSSSWSVGVPKAQSDNPGPGWVVFWKSVVDNRPIHARSTGSSQLMPPRCHGSLAPRAPGRTKFATPKRRARIERGVLPLSWGVVVVVKRKVAGIYAPRFWWGDQRGQGPIKPVAPSRRHGRGSLKGKWRVGEKKAKGGAAPSLRLSAPCVGRWRQREPQDAF